MEEQFKRLWRRLKDRGALVDGDVCLLSDVLYDLVLAANYQTGRWVKGWKIGDGRGKNLVENAHWEYIKTAQAGGRGKGLIHVNATALDAAHGKCVSSRALRDG